jgi:hypothetical protein
MSALKVNMALAKQAIRYVDKLGITSINVPVRPGSYNKSPLSLFDRFMLYYSRADTNMSEGHVNWYYRDAKEEEMEAIGGKLLPKEKQDLRAKVTGRLQDHKTVRSQILQIIHSTASKAQKKKQLTDLMKQVGFKGDGYGYDWFRNRTNDPDEERIRTVRKAVKFRHGNCQEKSGIAATWLLENTKNAKTIVWVGAENWDHAWAVMANAGTLPQVMVATGKYKTWPDDAVVVDGWTSDWYPVKHPYDAIKGTAANPFQLYVRKKVQDAQTAIEVKEVLQWPPVFAPAFRVENAGKKNSTYASPPPKLLDVVDDPSEFSQEIEDAQAVTT